MKKLFLCTLLILGVSFSCQKENSVLKSDEAIGIELAQDQTFKDFVKDFGKFALIAKEVNKNSLRNLENAKNDQEAKEIMQSLGFENEINSMLKNLKSLHHKYGGENINEQTITFAFKHSSENLLNNKAYSTIEKDFVNLRVAALPCTDVLDRDLVEIAAGFSFALYGCIAVAPAYGACILTATATAAWLTAQAFDNWDSCMADTWGYHPD